MAPRTSLRSFLALCTTLALAPPRLRAQCPDGSPPPCAGRQRAAAPPAANSVAVLYFENLSGDTADAYIPDGFTEEITARLGQLARLSVTSRAAAEQLQAVSDLGFIAYSRRRYGEARRWYDSAWALDSTVSNTLQLRARAADGDLTGALDDAARSLRLAAPIGRPRAAAVLAEMEARNGQIESARQRLRGMFAELDWPDGVPRSPISVRNAYEPALAALALGESDAAIAILEHARPRGPWLWSYLIWPGFDPIRGDPRFVQIFEQSKPPGVP